MRGLKVQRVGLAATMLIGLSACAADEPGAQVAARLAPDVVGTSRAALMKELEKITAVSRDRRMMMTVAPGGEEIIELLQAVRDPVYGETRTCWETLTVEQGVVTDYRRSGANC